MFQNDILAKKVVGKHEETGHQFSEPIFVARQGSTDEDDGVVISMVYKEDIDQFMGLLVLDAKCFNVMARVEFEIKGPATGTLHGSFRPNLSDTRVFS